MTNKEYYELVDESLVLFGGGAPCANIDQRLWDDFKQSYKEYNAGVPKVVDWSFDQVNEWLEAYKKETLERD